MSINFEKVLRENLSEGAFAIITSSEKEFSDWIARVKQQSVRCDELYRELKGYKDAEEQGLLLRLPVDFDKMIYVIEHGEIVEDTLFAVNQDVVGLWAIDTRGSLVGTFGTTVFASREEAEVALAEKGGAE